MGDLRRFLPSARLIRLEESRVNRHGGKRFLSIESLSRLEEGLIKRDGSTASSTCLEILLRLQLAFLRSRFTSHSVMAWRLRHLAVFRPTLVSLHRMVNPCMISINPDPWGACDALKGPREAALGLV